MPIMGGTATARYIRRAAPEIKILLLSVHDSGTIKEMAKVVGADAFLSKRCSVAELQQTIATLIEPQASLQSATAD